MLNYKNKKMLEKLSMSMLVAGGVLVISFILYEVFKIVANLGSIELTIVTGLVFSVAVVAMAIFGMRTFNK